MIMKAKILIVSLLFFCGISTFAQPDSLYFNANKLYQEGKYEEAIEKYESVLVAGYESSSLYYNLANASFRSNKFGKARLYYEKSLKLNPSDEDAKANLNHLQTLLADSFEELPVIFYKKWYKSLLISLSSNQWAYISMLSFFISSMALIAFLLLRQRSIRKIGFYASISLLLISIFCAFASWKQYNFIKTPEAAIVIDLSVNAKSAPRETGMGLFVLHEGAKVWLEDRAGGWWEIRLSDGRKAWVPESSIQTI